MNDVSFRRHPFDRQVVAIIAACGLIQMSMPPEHGRAVGAGPLEVHMEAPLKQLRLQLRRDYVRFHDRIHILLIDFDDVVHPSQVHVDYVRGEHSRPPRARRPERQFMLVAQFDDRLDFRSVFGKDERLRTWFGDTQA